MTEEDLRSRRSAWVLCVEEQKNYLFANVTPYEAMKNIIYMLNLGSGRPEPTINKTCSGYHLWFEREGKTYVARLDGEKISPRSALRRLPVR